MNYRVVVSPSPFRENEILGYYSSYWRAFIAALWHVTVKNDIAEAVIQRKR